MANDFQKDKKERRLADLEAKRERRLDPELRKRRASSGIGTKRQRVLTQQADAQENKTKQNTPETPPKTPEKNKPILRLKDKIEISAEAYRRFMEDVGEKEN